MAKTLKCEIGELDCRVITTEYRTRVHCIHMYHLLCNVLVHVIYSGISGQCSSITPDCIQLHGSSFRSLFEFEMRGAYAQVYPSDISQLSQSPLDDGCIY